MCIRDSYLLFCVALWYDEGRAELHRQAHSHAGAVDFSAWSFWQFVDDGDAIRYFCMREPAGKPVSQRMGVELRSRNRHYGCRYLLAERRVRNAEDDAFQN